MVTKAPQIAPGEKLELRQTSKALGVSPSTILKWTAAGKMKAGRKRVNGRMFWTGTEILRVWKANM